MKHLAAIVLAVAFAVPAMAQRGGDTGYVPIDPVTVMPHWHMLKRTAIRRYFSEGTGHVVLTHIDRMFGASGVHFEDPTGLVADSGGKVSFSRRFSVYGDARYTPVETHLGVTFGGNISTARIGERRVVVFTGIAFRF
jgi:outer membrane protein W